MGIMNGLRDVRTINRLLPEAEAEARRMGEERPGPEHLVLAAATLPDGSATRVLEQFGTDAEGLRAAVEAAHDDGLAAVGLDADQGDPAAAGLRAPARGVLQSTPQGQEVFQRAVALSKSTKPSRLLGAHVLAAACELERGTFVRALTALGIDRAALHDAALAHQAPR